MNTILQIACINAAKSIIETIIISLLVRQNNDEKKREWNNPHICAAIGTGSSEVIITISQPF